MDYNIDFPNSVDETDDNTSWESGDVDESVLLSKLEPLQCVMHKPSYEKGESQDKLKEPHRKNGTTSRTNGINAAKDACQEVVENIFNDAVDFATGDQAYNVINTPQK